ncbi:MAG TPA: cupredoxin domain-containing protein [Actinomycetota bacterium]|nr:cupredoxin domain-containing protein [Actinomycetota bacterium]
MRSKAARLVLVALTVTALVVATMALRGDPAPYVVTAIDYHFHDAHPTFPIAPGRELIVDNEGRNVHSVTIPALEFSRNVRPGGRLVVGRVADMLEPGRYELICQIHLDRGMTGTIVIAE